MKLARMYVSPDAIGSEVAEWSSQLPPAARLMPARRIVDSRVPIGMLVLVIDGDGGEDVEAG